MLKTNVDVPDLDRHPYGIKVIEITKVNLYPKDSKINLCMCLTWKIALNLISEDNLMTLHDYPDNEQGMLICMGHRCLKSLLLIFSCPKISFLWEF